MLDPLSEGTNILKGANQIGKDLGNIVADQQSSMENAVKQAHKQRMEAAARKAQQEALEEFQAVKKYEEQKNHALAPEPDRQFVAADTGNRAEQKNQRRRQRHAAGHAVGVAAGGGRSGAVAPVLDGSDEGEG